MVGKRNDHRRSAPTHSFGADTYLVEGLSAIREYLRLRPKCIKTIEFTASHGEKVRTLLSQHKVDIRTKSFEEGAERPSSSPVWATVELRTLDEDSWQNKMSKRTKDLVVALDHVTDSRNVGAIVRTAAFFGIREIIIPEDRQAMITNGAVSAAQGGFAACDLVRVTNLARTIERLKEKHGYWIVGTDMQGEALEKAPKGFDKAVLVMGSEDRGLSANVLSRCDVKVAIMGKPIAESTEQGAAAAEWALESLNVSVAAGIFIHAFSRS